MSSSNVSQFKSNRIPLSGQPPTKEFGLHPEIAVQPFAPEAFADDLRRRTVHPLKMSSAYEKLIAECEAQHKLRRNRHSSSARLWPWQTLLQAVLLICLWGFIIWCGLEMVPILIWLNSLLRISN